MKKALLPIPILLLGLLLAACSGGTSQVKRTPIPTLIPATLAAPSGAGRLASLSGGERCAVQAVDLIGAWVSAGSPETTPFDFTDASGKACQGTFANDVRFLFTESNVWFDGALACSACHGPDLAESYANMNLGDYQGILAGSRRQSAGAKGSDILGGGDWTKARLNQVLVTRFMPLGRPQTSPEKGPLVMVGKVK